MSIKFDQANKTPISEGGEGFIYQSGDSVVKIFKSHVDIQTKKRKITALLNMKLPSEVVAPTEIVTDRNGKFSGYQMKMVDGEDFKRLSVRKFVVANKINMKFVLSLLVKVKDTMQKLHKNNVYIGDLNDQNILFDMSGNVFFIDCDSWSIGNDTCTVAMDSFKDPLLVADKFNEKTDNYAFAVLSWKSLTRIHPFGGVMDPDIPILDRMRRGISVIDRPDVKLPRTTKSWNGLSPELVDEFKDIFERKVRDLSDNLEDMLANLTYCDVDKEYYYSKFSSCPYCNKDASVNKKPISQGVMGGLKLYAMYNEDNIEIVFDRFTYKDVNGNVVNGSNSIKYQPLTRYHFIDSGCVVTEFTDSFVFETDQRYRFEKQFKSQIVVEGDNVYYLSPTKTLMRLTITSKGNALNSICKVGNTAYFAVDDGNYCILNYYEGKIIVNINGANTMINYNSDVVNYGIHRDKRTNKWLIIIEDSAGKFYTYVIDKNRIDYYTDAIKYECQLSYCCIDSSTIFIPITEKIRGFNYAKSAFKDFECSVVSDDSKLIKDGGKFVIINTENVYILGK